MSLPHGADDTKSKSKSVATSAGSAAASSAAGAAHGTYEFCNRYSGISGSNDKSYSELDGPFESYDEALKFATGMFCQQLERFLKEKNGYLSKTRMADIPLLLSKHMTADGSIVPSQDLTLTLLREMAASVSCPFSANISRMEPV